ncbi:MAG TPA: ferredoxin [Acidobacteriota bacterium]|nr:ferredoxin [Acidobacteriota bacterium]HQG92917.1 ferredoxin [Acidobacteriota bacterium]HQK88193.1 ferredoxin [Acidobacteriota bacterium]
MGNRAYVDPDLCTGCTLCTDLCPEVFEMDGDVAVARHPDHAARGVTARAQEAADACPVQAITLDHD